MENSFGSRLKHAWNAFTSNRDPTRYYRDVGPSYSYRVDRPRFSRGNERSIATSVYNRIALDVSSIDIRHCRLDDNERFIETIDSKLNSCLNLEANIDQSGRAFIQDIVMSMFDEGCVAVVPVDTTLNPEKTGSYDIETMRTGKVVTWHPEHVKVRLYNDKTGEKEEVLLPKKMVAIIENPLYAVINEPNSTMQRLIRKLNLLDSIDEQSGAGKLDLIIQLPYVVKSEKKREQAEQRRKDIEMQLAGSKYGIAYTDGTERVTQLNRPVENNLMKQIEYLTSMLYSQLGITQTILDGTADEQTMLNYYSRSIEPIIAAIVDEMKRKFLTKTARSQGQTIAFFRDPFKLVPVKDLAELADKFTRNEIMTSNELRQTIGLKPSNNPRADELVNKNLSSPTGAMPAGTEPVAPGDTYGASNQALDILDEEINGLKSKLGGSDLTHYASPYYDPVKAHEYYMRTRELKGRTSTSSLNEEGKATAKYVKEQLNTERKSKVEAHKQQTNSQVKSNNEEQKEKLESLREDLDEDISSHCATTQAKIDALYEKLDGMSADELSANEAQIYDEIASLEESNEKARANLQNKYRESSASVQEKTQKSNASLRSEHTAEKARLKTEYDEKYAQELEKIKQDPKFQKVGKSGSKSDPLAKYRIK